MKKTAIVLLNNWDYLFGGGVGISTSLTMIWVHVAEHVIEASVCTLFVTIIGGATAHYLRVLLPIIDRKIAKFLNK